MLDDNKECATADFCSVDALNRLSAAFSKAALLNQAFEAGLPGITQEMVKTADEAPAQILKGICETYSRAAVRSGSITDRLNLPQFIRNESGKETPADPAVIADMAAARGQVFDDE